MANEYQIFNSGLLGALKTKNFVTSAETDPMCDAGLISLSDFAAKKGFDLSGDWIGKHYNGAQVAALTDYMEFLETWVGVPKTFTLSTVTVQVQFPVGKSGAVLTLGASAIVDNEKFMGRAYIEVYDSILTAYDIFRDKRRVEPATSSAKPTNGNGSAASEIVSIDDIIVEEKNGKRYYKLGGGRWQKFGVSCWPEVFENAGFDVDEFETGRNPFNKGYQMVIELDNDKPRKVSKIVER